MTSQPASPEPASPEGSAVDVTSELARMAALPLEERPRVLAETVRRLEEELDATEARPGGR